MRTTLRIDDDLFNDLKQRAQTEKSSLTDVVNQVIRQGMKQAKRGGRSRRRFRQKTFDMGQPLVDLTKALALAARLEDEETLEKLARRK